MQCRNEARGCHRRATIASPLVGGESLDVEPVVLGAQRKEASVVEVCDGADDRGLVFERATVAY